MRTTGEPAEPVAGHPGPGGAAPPGPDRGGAAHGAEPVGIEPAAGEPGGPRPRPRLRRGVQLAFVAAAVAFGAWTLLPQVDGLRQTATALRNPHWGWVAAALLSAVATYPTLALSIQAVSPRRLPFWRTAAGQLASSFTTQLAPGGLGRIGLNQRFLERAGVRRPDALAGLGLHAAMAVAVHVTLLLLCLPLAGLTIGVPAGNARLALLAGGAALLVLLTLLCQLPVVRRRLVHPALDALRRLRELFTHPGRAALLAVTTLAVLATWLLCLAASLAAVGGDLSLVKVAAAYLIASGLGYVSPTPGGLGVVEASLVAALTAAGMPAPTALAGVLLYRLIAFWLPLPPGAAALHWLARVKAV